VVLDGREVLGLPRSIALAGRIRLPAMWRVVVEFADALSPAHIGVTRVIDTNAGRMPVA
jgi:hypothetical protein